MVIHNVPKWNKDAKEFAVNVHYNEDKGTQVRVPKPILEKMGNPKRISFVMDGKIIKVRPELEEAVRDLIKHKKEKSK